MTLTEDRERMFKMQRQRTYEQAFFESLQKKICILEKENKKLNKKIKKLEGKNE